MNKVLLGVLAVAIVAGGGYLFTTSRGGVSSMGSETNSEEEKMLETEKVMNEDEGIATAEGDSMVKDDMVSDEADMDGAADMKMMGSYEAYSEEKLARAETGDVVLFFSASWCPSCRALGNDIEKNMGAIPEGVSILKVDYDTEVELKKKYGVTYQHTLVQVDTDGTLIKKWSGSLNLDKLVAQIQ